MITLFKTERGVRMEYDVIDGIPIMKEKYNNPFDNLYQMVYCCFSLSDLHDTNAEIEKNQKELVGMLKELTSDDSDVMDGLDAIIKELEVELHE